MSEESNMFTVPRNENQISSFPGQTTFVTGHSKDGKAIVQEKRPGVWAQFNDKQMAFSNIFVNEFHTDLNGDADLKFDEETRKNHHGLVNKNAVTLRQVDFAPATGEHAVMHRTKSLDYGVVLEGEVEMVLDDGSVTKLRRGDVAIQRGTMHAWRNPSKTEFARLLFVLQDIKPLHVNGQYYGEDLSTATGMLPPSGNEE